MYNDKLYEILAEIERTANSEYSKYGRDSNHKELSFNDRFAEVSRLAKEARQIIDRKKEKDRLQIETFDNNTKSNK